MQDEKCHGLPTILGSSSVEEPPSAITGSAKLCNLHRSTGQMLAVLGSPHLLAESEMGGGSTCVGTDK